jgi:hypothetical protein
MHGSINEADIVVLRRRAPVAARYRDGGREVN